MKNERWENYDAYLKSSEWAHIRTMVLERAKFRCQVCNSKHILHVHHRVYDCRWGEESTDDLIALCQSCHSLFHRKEPEIKREQKKIRKEENIAKEAARQATSKKKKKKKTGKGKESPYAKTARLSGPVRPFGAEEVKAYESNALASMEALKQKRAEITKTAKTPMPQKVLHL